MSAGVYCVYEEPCSRRPHFSVPKEQVGRLSVLLERVHASQYFRLACAGRLEEGGFSHIRVYEGSVWGVYDPGLFSLRIYAHGTICRDLCAYRVFRSLRVCSPGA